MIIDYAKDGQEFDKNLLIEQGFFINENRDYRRKFMRDSSTGEKNEDYKNVLDFVGFLVNMNNDVFTVFPKNYRVENKETDSKQLFNVISSHMQRRPEMYIGKEYDKLLSSNYPFASFFGVYEYFSKYGLYFEDKKFIKPNSGGKINWKETVRLTNKYISNGKVSFFPIYYDKNYYLSAFLTECMIFAIDYTIDKFGLFISLDKTGKSFPNYNFISQKESVLEYLLTLRQQTFKDNIINLIDHLINFFYSLNEGGNYYLKHYSFSSIWEDIVMYYLKLNFKEVKNEQIVLDYNNSRHADFSKISFNPNIANKKHFISPDYYYADKDMQLIFDAKYYSSIRGIDYKQIAYFLFLNEYREKLNDDPKYTQTFSALILPSKHRSNKIHFRMDPNFNKSYQNLVISEEYFDIREVINCYLTV